MTIIKIKENLKFKGCYDCPFLESVDGGLDNDVFCSIYLNKHDNYLVPTLEESDCIDDEGLTRGDKPVNCPIISMEIIEDGSD